MRIKTCIELNIHNKPLKIIKIDKKTQAILLAWIEKNLGDCENPYLFDKELIGNRSQEWSYRIGDYGIIADIQEDKILILVLLLDITSIFMADIKSNTLLSVNFFFLMFYS